MEELIINEAIRLKEYVHTGNIESDKNAVIVEPRNHKCLEGVVRNVMYNLGSDWNLTIFAHDEKWIQNLFPDWRFTLNILQVNNLSVEQYNQLLKSKDFWKKIDGEHILIFQTDSIINNNTKYKIDEFLEYPLIGGIYNFRRKFNCPPLIDGYIQADIALDQPSIDLCSTPHRHFSICGGFSLRKKKIMLECIKYVTKSDILIFRRDHEMDNSYFEYILEISEDSFFSHAIEILGYDLPNIYQCTNFCNNGMKKGKFNKLNAFSFHQGSKLQPHPIQTETERYFKYLISNSKNKGLCT
jgi:hypothetical protein